MREIFDVVEPYIEKRYGIPIKITDVPDPFTGDLDGEQIHVDYAEDIESALFIVVHLFGHTTQWNTDPASREIGYKLYTNPTEAEMKALYEYEYEAARYSLQLFHEAGIRDIDQWVSDYSACDFKYLDHYYRTGEKRPFKSFWKDGCELLLPKPIPPFRPEKWVGRIQGIVV